MKSRPERPACPISPLRLARPRPRLSLLASWSVLAFAGVLGCMHDPTIGPLFTARPAPEPGLTRIYLYRFDPRHSYSTVEIRFDEGEPLQILDEEYITVELEEGVHEIQFRLRRRFWGPSWSWRTQRIRAQSGEVIYFEIAVAITGSTTPTSREMQIAGRPVGTAGESVSIEMKRASEAVERIRMTHLHVP